MVDSRVLVPEKGKSRLGSVPDPEKAWGMVGWLGVVLLVVGLGDFILGWIPLHFGNPEWEFGTITATFSGLPLVTMGFAALMGAAIARGRRVTLLLGGIGLALLAMFIGAVYIIFLLDVPLALGAVEGVAELGIKKAIAKTTLMGGGFGIAYVWAAVVTLRHLARRRRIPNA